jgi:CheY-like chemotaxis protein
MTLFESGAFDVVFTDLGMPGMSGWEVARGIKTMRPGTPVGLITGWGSSLEESELAAHGVDLIVPKPFRFERVLELVDEAVRLKERLS